MDEPLITTRHDLTRRSVNTCFEITVILWDETRAARRYGNDAVHERTVLPGMFSLCHGHSERAQRG